MLNPEKTVDTYDYDYKKMSPFSFLHFFIPVICLHSCEFLGPRICEGGRN